MPLSATVWQDGLATDPQSAAAKQFERLRQRRVQVRAEVRAADLAEQEADRRLVAAQRETRLKRAERNAMGSKLAVAASAASLVAAEEQSAKATARTRDAADALQWLDHEAEALVARHADELLRELATAAESAEAALVDSTRQAREAVAAWLAVARRQEAVLQAAGGSHRDTRAPVEQLRAVNATLAQLDADLPAAAVGTQGGGA